MRLERVCAFLKTVPRYQENGDRSQITVKCPFCGDSQKSDHGHFSIKIEVEPNSPMMYTCFRADCGAKGILTAKTLDLMGCRDIDALAELEAYNKTINIRTDNGFVSKHIRDYQIVNVIRSDTKEKLAYLNKRLGVEFNAELLRRLKIQLSLYSFLNINFIRTLAFGRQKCDLLDENCICFLSMYNDYLICRDLTKNLVTGMRYTMYRASGKPDPNDMKLYCIPTELDLMDPEPADINVAEGPFSIIGAFLHTDLGRDHNNTIWMANCGAEYKKTILHAVRQYGLTEAHIHIWSDSEIGIEKYEKLYKEIKHHMNVLSLNVHYNKRFEDFGTSGDLVEVKTIRLI